MNNTRIATVAILLAGSLGGSMFAAAQQPPSGHQQLRVEAPIVGVHPITEGGAPVCDVGPPQRAAGLAATLRWDLYGRCRPAETKATVTGYRVTYEWDGRRFDTVLAQRPEGDTLALQLRIN